MGLVGDAFSRKEVIAKLPGNAAIGHNRYSTTGDYPTPLTDQSKRDHAPRQLSLLAEAS
jgi:glutamine phosphoribosylpyrophosphate amidotransferase